MELETSGSETRPLLPTNALAMSKPRALAWAPWLVWSTLACGGGGGSTGGADPMGTEPADPSCTTQLLPFYVQDAVYSPTLERIVALSGYAVFLLDPTNAQSVKIPFRFTYLAARKLTATSAAVVSCAWRASTLSSSVACRAGSGSAQQSLTTSIR